MGTIVETTGGRLAGREKDGVHRFGGIPFAAAPVGPLRFRPPQPHPGWAGERDATGFGAMAPQKPGAIEMLAAGGGEPEWSEDCLFLNVWTPATDDARRPVMVWIHGGGFTGGSGSIPWYHGVQFAQHGDVVVVTINYRLGALGFLHLGHLDPAESGGNVGLLDQVAALEWVRDNIAAFGGDPGNVTIFGESAGGMSVGTLLGTPAAGGLFHKAIAQSGAAHNVCTADEAAEVTARMLAALDVSDVAGLRDVDAGRMLDAQTDLATAIVKERSRRSDSAGIGLAFTPVVDGDVLPLQPLDAVRDGSAAAVPLMTGTTREEWKLFNLMLSSVDDEATLLRRIGRMVEDPAPIAAAYRESHGDAAPDDLWTAVMTDHVFRIPAIRMAEAQVPHQRTWMYQFDWASTAFDGRLGACHALEIPFVFDCLGKGGAGMFTGPDAPASLADDMHHAWIAFARTGDPNHDGLPDWPAYDVEQRSTMHFDVPSTLRHDPAPEARAVWDGVL